MIVRRRKNHLSFYLQCDKPAGYGKWSIEAQWKQVLLSKYFENECMECNRTFGNIDGIEGICGYEEFIEWAQMENDFIEDDQLTAEIHVKIKKTTGIYRNNLRQFGETTEELSDVVLVVNEKKFYVPKLYLAAQSPYFKALFLGDFNDSKKSEIELSGIDGADFQKYLEVLYGEKAIDEFTVEGILMVADMYETPLVIRNCKEFLLEKSKKSLKKKLNLANRYHLHGLKKQCLDNIKSVADIRSVMTGDVSELDPSIMRELLEKSLALHNPQ